MRRRILEAFFIQPGLTVHVRELARRLGLAPAVLGRELARLEEAGVLRSELVGRSRQYSVDERSAVAGEVRSLFQKTVGVEALLARALRDVPGVEEAFIFGSYARGEERSQSDLDLFIVGRPDRRVLSERLADAEERLGREVNTVRLTRAQLDELRERGSGFLRQVMSAPRVTLVPLDEGSGGSG